MQLKLPYFERQPVIILSRRSCIPFAACRSAYDGLLDNFFVDRNDYMLVLEMVFRHSEYTHFVIWVESDYFGWLCLYPATALS